jgi:pyruvate/2-oxoglutarate dehydrogenase complex dihydrolipoamide acyltransferase (E2) component
METVPVVVPQMGVVEEFILLEWLVDDGSSVAEGQALATIETEKTELEVESPASGQLQILLSPSPEPIQIAEPLAIIVSG